MTTQEIIKALRCTANADCNCKGKQCPFWMQEDIPEELREQCGKDTWDSCDVDGIALAAADLLTRSQWISVEERLPEPSTFVLALTAPGSLSLGQNCVVADYIHPRNEEYGIFAMAYDYREPLKVTHWMELPEPPKEGAEK